MFNQQYHQSSLQRGQKQTSLWIKCHVFYLILWDVGYKCDERLQRDKLIIPKILTLLRSGLFCFLRPGGAPSESPSTPPPPFPHPSSNLAWYRHSRIMSSSFPTSRQWHVWRHHEVSIVKVVGRLFVRLSNTDRLKSSTSTILRNHHHHHHLYLKTR